MNGWRVEQLRGDASALHGRDALARPERSVTLLEVDGSALVLGSTQRDDLVDHDAAAALDVELTRRRTGGGAVFLAPGEHVWIDVTIPAGDPLWHDDVAGAFSWLGGVWAATLADLGVPGTVVNHTAVCHSVLGRLICFAGLGFGEVSGADGKLVGLAQRRARAGAWFQCTLLRRWDVGPYATLLAPGLATAADDVDDELAAVRVQPVDLGPDDVLDALARHLPS